MEFKLIPQDEIHTIIPLRRLLNDSIEQHTLEQRLSEMVLQGYECVGVYEHKQLIGICGLWIVTKYYVGKHIEPDNMLVLPEYQSKGIGKQLMQWIYEYGRSKGCVASELNCYITNESAKKFWESEGYTEIACHYQRKL